MSGAGAHRVPGVGTPRAVPLDMRNALHRGIHWMTAKLERADELVDSRPIVALETAFGMVRYLSQFLGVRTTDSQTN
jgi:hypothetical protein